MEKSKVPPFLFLDMNPIFQVVTLTATFFMVALTSVQNCQATSAFGDYGAETSKSRFDAILAQFGFQGLGQPDVDDTGVIDNLVEREIDQQHRGEVDDYVAEDSSLGVRVARRVPLVRLNLDNKPFPVYGEDSAKMLRKVKKVKKAPVRKLRRRPRLVLLNSEGELRLPRLQHLNVRVPKMYSFKSRYMI